MLEDKVVALHNEVKELRRMLAKMQNANQHEKQTLKLSLEEKISRVYVDLLATAKQAGVNLPRT